MNITIKETFGELTAGQFSSLLMLTSYLEDSGLKLKYLIPVAKEMGFMDLEEFLQVPMIEDPSTSTIVSWNCVFKWDLEEIEHFLRNRYSV